MALTRCEAIVVRTYPLGDTSRIAVLYSREFGLVRGVAKGARGSKSRFGAGLEPLSRVDVTLYRKDGRDLDLLSKVDVIEDWRASDLARVAHAQAALELVDRLVWESEPMPPLYALLVAALEAMRTVPVETLASVTLGFQLQAAGLLGYRPEIDRCAGCGAPPSGRWAPARGGAVCERCAETESLCAAASPEALAGLAHLVATPLDVLEPFASPRAGEMLKLTELYLKSHFQRFAGFKSLAMLLSLEGVPA
ncbi:MAG: DNA repair protein RecO [Candidatus Eiseniibacteriota bacterium]